MDAAIRFCILVLGAVSTIASYAGLTTALPHDGLWWKIFCAIIAAGIGVAIATFWRVAFDTVTKPIQNRFQALGWAIVIVGCFFISGISAWWHVAAIGGPAAITASVYETLTTAEKALAGAGQSRNSYKGFLSRLEALAAEIGSLAECEAASGCVSGSAGKKGIHGLLTGLKNKADGIVASIKDADARFDVRIADAKSCLADLRSALSGGAESDGGSSKAASVFDCVNVAIAEIDGSGLVARIAQEMESLTVGVVVPPSIQTTAQKQAVESILSGLKDRADGIAKDARQIAGVAAMEPISLPRMSAMQAVAVHYKAILPAWITGLALDLMPVLLLGFQATLVGSRRALPDAPAHEFTAADLLKAVAIITAVREATKPQNGEHPVSSPVIDGDAEHVNRIAYRSDDDEPAYVEEDLDVGEDTVPDDAT